jgi:hypothetical protein
MLDGEIDGLSCNPSRAPESGDASRAIGDVEGCARLSSCNYRISAGNSYRVDNLYVNCQDEMPVEVSVGGAVRVLCVTGDRQGQAGTDWKGGRG